MEDREVSHAACTLFHAMKPFHDFYEYGICRDFSSTVMRYVWISERPMLIDGYEGAAVLDAMYM